ncbi:MULTISPECIES: hypothetical protein [Vibrio]|uniref:hypothetical protein n=1 Tax=Vibrio TaxID=662 RepID=UPI0001B95668|nr:MULTISPECIES: hypothetical protein [Vibrio]EEX33398.1 hypothetical protein VIC_002852 [Vibrio coralliilyticus ATCC BAA-450]MCM5508354.1 hypothetical protein [Vibrio sp. SCSIO 43169]MDE3897060.1 hypothetical protein [Vibrio sp. CC007]QFT38305.1 hypothetical protein FIU99_18230 [Vibrio sp. THAF64]QGM37157.1 hypothetical protein GGC04_22995 [Vibrio sp. THAF191d]
MNLTQLTKVSLLATVILPIAQTYADMNSARNQHFAREYRTLCETTAEPFETANSPDEAAQQSLRVSKPFAKTLTLNEQGLAYLNLSIENWDEKLVLFHSKQANIEIKDADVTGKNITNQHCDKPDMIISHINTHEWGSYPVKVSGKPNQRITIKFYREQNR